MSDKSQVASILNEGRRTILDDWIKAQLVSLTLRKDLMRESELRGQSDEFLRLFIDALQSGGDDAVTTGAWKAARDFLETISRSRAHQGFSPSETATFVFSLKEPLLLHLRQALAKDDSALFERFMKISLAIDQLGLYTTEVYQKGREEIIVRQQQEMIELSTPVVKLWDGILALPMIGTLDSNRSQVVMESLLQRIVETGSEVAIIDITGVPMVDTLVAQHLMKTISAARLMGAECIISGIRPQIAQTIVHLAIDLGNIVTKATLADAFVVALQRRGIGIGQGRMPGHSPAPHA